MADTFTAVGGVGGNSAHSFVVAMIPRYALVVRYISPVHSKLDTITRQGQMSTLGDPLM